MDCSRFDSDTFLELIHLTLKRWKWAEEKVIQEDSVFTRTRNRIRAEALKSIYLEMLSEARSRNLALTDKQLMDRILYTSSDFQDSENQG